MAMEKLRDLSQPIDVPLLDATVAAFYGTGSKEEVKYDVFLFYLFLCACVCVNSVYLMRGMWGEEYAYAIDTRIFHCFYLMWK